MTVKNASRSLKVLLLLFGLGLVFLGASVLPKLADEMLVLYPHLQAAKLPILWMSELLLLLLLFGLGNIMYLILLFDKDLTFSSKFTKALELLIFLCMVAVVGILVLFQYISRLEGPGSLPSIIMIGVLFIILILVMVIVLIRAIVNETIVYKSDYDLTV